MALSLSQKFDARQVIIFSCLAFVGAILNIRATMPGYLYDDSKLVLDEIEHNHLNDWHSPFYAWLWQQFTKILPGPEFITIFNISGLWLGCLGIALATRRRLGWKAGLFTLVPLMPGMQNLTGTVVIDTTMNVFFLIAIVFSLLSLSTERAGTIACFMFLSVASVTGAVLVRNNAIFAALPLLLVNAALCVRHTRSGHGRRLVFAASLCGVVLAGSAVKHALKPAPWHPIISLEVKHLQQLSYYEQKNLFPGQWSAEQDHRILRSCDKFNNWDNDAGWGHCGFIFNAANHSDDSRHALSKAWIQAVATHPFEFFLSSLPTYRVALFNPMRTVMMFNGSVPGVKISWQDQEPWHGYLHALHAHYIESRFNFKLGRPCMGIFLSSLALIACFVTRTRLDGYDRVFCAVMISGLVYLFTFLPINVATEYRYYLWGLLAAELGAVYVVASLCGPACFTFSKKALPPFIKGLVAVGLALVVTTKLFSYPQEVRTFTITPLGKSPTRIQYLREDIDKFWTDAFEGHVRAPGWEANGNGFLSHKDDGPFTMTLSLPYQDAALGYTTGPDYGNFRVCERGKCQTVEAHSATAGEQTLLLPGSAPPLGSLFTLKWVALFLSLILVLYYLLIPCFLLAGRTILPRHTA
ncbi:glycosyltransferase family 39 protein [Acetobacter cerevisiae]|uniref:glycosyltransferase family 39 protein n=1 Tax=Acetobacter cerevisiae TaxID=178900 RepID=UPI00209C8A38|nr:glycosyltransferase family 39 protein [Acetobacter cerevisiae]MCP1270276.1 glycosyltransferase family 39 protein [Acetobacter cerevisiae]MCP1278229.1 glycosyltransferase family 39 protein [Acetobacter cerevisiae]